MYTHTMVSETHSSDPLIAAISALRRRMLFTLWTQMLVMSLIVSTGLSCVWLLFTRLFPGFGPVEPVAIVAMLAGILFATVYAIWRRPGLLKAALEADRRLGLQERLTSSLQLAGVAHPMVDALHQDARAQLARLDYRREFPYVAPRSLRWLAGPVFLFLVGYLLLPEFDLFGQRARKAEAKAKETAVRIEAERIADAAKAVRELESGGAAGLDGLAESIERIAASLKTGEITEKQAFARLANLTNQLTEQRQNLAAKTPIPDLRGDISKLDLAKELAENIRKGDVAKAAEMANEMAGKLGSGEATEEEKQQIGKELGELSRMLEMSNPELAEAMARMAASIDLKDAQGLKEAMEQFNLTLEDLKSLREQMAKLAECEGKLGECKNKLYCPYCKGVCVGGQCPGYGLGMLGKGVGRGNTIGELPDVNAAFEPKLATGDMTKGKVLATIMQRAAPTEEGQATVDYSAQALVQVRQQSEEALNKEDIPPGAREYVRQYFGSLEPDRQNPAPEP